MNNIVITFYHIKEKLSGTGYYIKRILRVLQEVDSVNQYTLIVSDIKEPEKIFEIKAKNYKIIKYPDLNSKLSRIIFEQFILPFKVKANIFFSPSVAVPLLLNPKIKIITTIHDLIPFITKDKYSFIQRNYIKFITKMSSLKADIILTVSENSRKDIISLLKVSVDKIKILYNFLDYDDSQAKACEEPDKKENYFLTVSDIQPGKNLIRLFKAYKKYTLLTEYSDTKLIVVGKKGWNYKEIFEEVNNLELSDKIEFPGYVNEEELQSYYRNAKAFLYVSLYEGFGIPPLEAMYYKCPVVVSNVSSLPEVTGKAGIYVDPYNIDSIYEGIRKTDDMELVKEKTSFMQNEVDKFNGRKEVKKLLRIFS